MRRPGAGGGRTALGRTVAAELRAQRWRLGGALATVVVSAALVAAGPSVVRYAFDSGMLARDAGALRLAVGLALGLLLLTGLVGGLRTYLMTTLAQRVLHRMRCGVLAGVLARDLADHVTAPRGDVQARATSDIESLTSAVENLIPDFVRDLVLVVGGLVAVGILAPQLMLIAMLALPPAVLAGRWLLRRSAVVYPALYASNGRALGVVTETVEGAATIAALRAGERRLETVRTAGADLVRAELAAAALRNWFYSTLIVVQSAGTAAVVVGAGLLVTDGRVSVGTAAAAILALTGVYGPLSQAIGRLDEVLSARAAFVRVAELADRAVPAGDDTGVDLPARGELELRGVGYRYPGAEREPALVDVDLRVGPGEHLAVVGETGSGKSTLGRLAAGLLTPTAGTVSLGGVDLAAASSRARRKRLMLLPQETFLLSGTVADNARIATPEVDDAVVEAAADRLGVRGWIDSLPDGVRTDVGPAGSRLSTGERQLVALLRVAMADPAVLVLDEATSVLDPGLDAAVGEAMARLSADRVVIVVAHRPHTADRCDAAVVLRDGRVVERGTPAVLAGAGGAYARLWATLTA